MAWTPARKIINSRAIAENLLAFFEANQAEALVWAGGSLKPIRKFSNSVANRAVPVYPSTAFSDDNDAVDYSSATYAQAAYSVTFEIAVQSQDPDKAVTDSRKYLAAFLSMLLNCPGSTTTANTGASSNLEIQSVETGFDPIRANDKQNDFLQMFQIRTVFSLHEG